MLRNLAQFYHKDPLNLFVVRLAQVRGEGEEEVGVSCACPSPHLTGPHPLGQGDSDPQPVPLRPHADVPCGGGWTSDSGCVHVGPQQQYALGLEGWGGGRYWIGHVVLFLYSHSRRSQLHVILFNARHPAPYACDIQCRPGASDGDCESGPGRCVGVWGGQGVWGEIVCVECAFLQCM